MKTHEKYLKEIGTGGGRPGPSDFKGMDLPAMISREKKSNPVQKALDKQKKSNPVQKALDKKKKLFPKGQNIKDMAQDFTSEIEVMIENLIHEWSVKDEFADMRTDDIKKMVNLAIKNINIRRIM